MLAMETGRHAARKRAAEGYLNLDVQVYIMTRRDTKNMPLHPVGPIFQGS